MINCMIIYVYDNDDDNDDDEGKYILCPWTVLCVRFDVHKWEKERERDSEKGRYKALSL